MNKAVKLWIATLIVLCAALLWFVPALADEPLTMTLNFNSVEINLAETSRGGQLEPTLSQTVSRPQFTYVSSDTNVARVSSRGVITGRTRGMATITVLLRGTDVYATCDVIVLDTRIPESITLDKGSEISAERYETFTITPTVAPAVADQRVQWKSSNSSVASVNSKGLVTARKGGTAVITCTSRRDRKVFATLNVTVNQYPSPTAITLTPATSYMVIGTTMQMTPVTQPVGEKVCSIFTWSSSSGRIASVTQDGLITAHRAGYVTIACRSKQNGRVSATRKILVVEPDSPYYITLNTENDTVTLNPTDVLPLTYAVYPADRNQSVKWTTSRSSVAFVDQNGVVTARKAGTAVITATSTLNRLVKVQLTLKVVNLPAPDSIELSAPASVIELGDTLQITPKTYPVGEKRSQEFRWRTSSSSVARVSADGLVTAHRVGTATITCYSLRNSRIKQTYTVKVIDSKMPESVTFSDVAANLSLENGQEITLTPVVTPSTAIQTVKWRSTSSSVATVTENGVVTARRAGSAYIYATSTYSSSKYVRVKVTVTNKAAPTALAFTVQHLAVYAGKSTSLCVLPTPINASTLCTFSSSDPSIAAVDKNGNVTTTAKTGIVTITARSIKNSAVAATMTIAVYNESTPGSVNLGSKSLYLGRGVSQQLSASVFPATATQTLTWSSENPAVVTVDATGRVDALSIGSTWVTATAVNGLTARARVSVTAVQVVSAIPARTTPVSGINSNMAKIDAIRECTFDIIDAMGQAGEISASEVTARQAIIKRAFDMQAFPWMTLNTQEYWTTKYAEKRYMPGVVYYGLPYIQSGRNGSWANRNYNVDKAVSEGRYYASGNGYYLLDQKKLLNSSYVGNDCSSFVNIATFGLNHPASQLKTYTMATSSYYKTLSGFDQLRPGDHFVMAKNHVVMFLYWMNAEKTQFMVIEQGGNGSTIICSIKDVAYYSSQGYVPRRVKTFN